MVGFMKKWNEKTKTSGSTRCKLDESGIAGIVQRKWFYIIVKELFRKMIHMGTAFVPLVLSFSKGLIVFLLHKPRHEGPAQGTDKVDQSHIQAGAAASHSEFLSDGGNEQAADTGDQAYAGADGQAQSSKHHDVRPLHSF